MTQESHTRLLLFEWPAPDLTEPGRPAASGLGVLPSPAGLRGGESGSRPWLGGGGRDAGDWEAPVGLNRPTPTQRRAPALDTLTQTFSPDLGILWKGALEAAEKASVTRSPPFINVPWEMKQ